MSWKIVCGVRARARGKLAVDFSAEREEPREPEYGSPVDAAPKQAYVVPAVEPGGGEAGRLLQRPVHPASVEKWLDESQRETRALAVAVDRLSEEPAGVYVSVSGGGPGLLSGFSPLGAVPLPLAFWP